MDPFTRLWLSDERRVVSPIRVDDLSIGHFGKSYAVGFRVGPFRLPVGSERRDFHFFVGYGPPSGARTPQRNQFPSSPCDKAAR